MTCVFCGHAARVDGTHIDATRDRGHRAGPYVDGIVSPRDRSLLEAAVAASALP